MPEISTRAPGAQESPPRSATRPSTETQPSVVPPDLSPALVEAVVDMRSGAFLSENVYIRRDKRIRDVAVLFLVDMSSSTEEEVDGRRVIDIQKEAMVLMAEALDALEDPYAIYGFSSEGRFRVDLFGVKDFTEPYSDSVRYRLGKLVRKHLVVTVLTATVLPAQI